MNIQLRRLLNSYHNNFSRPSGNNAPNCPWPLRLFKWQKLWVTLQQSLQINRIKVWASIRLGQFQQQMENAFSGLKNDNSLKSVNSISSTTLNVFNTKRIDWKLPELSNCRLCSSFPQYFWKENLRVKQATTWWKTSDMPMIFFIIPPYSIFYNYWFPRF